MRIKIPCAFLMLSVLFGSYAGAEPDKKPKLSFALAFDCLGGPDSIPIAEWCEGRCLDRSFKAGLKVALINETGVFGAKTAATCTYAYRMNDLDKATQLAEDKNRKYETAFGTLALVGVDAAAVRVVPDKVDGSPVPKEIELKARELLNPTVRDLCDRYARRLPPLVISDSPPKITRAGNVSLIKFRVIDQDAGPGDGPAVLLIKGRVFRLCGALTYRHLFFSVNDKLHLFSRMNYCTACGEAVFVVYDLSGNIPRVVFWDPTFST